MYSIGQIIIYTTYGICRIDSIIQREFNGQVMDYYILTPLNGTKASLQVQVNNPVTLEKLRALLSKEELEELIVQIPFIEPYWIENENERKKHFATILRSGKRSEIIGIMRSIYNHQTQLKDRGKKLHACDEQYLKDAEKIIYEEMSYVLNIEKSSVNQFLSTQFEK